MAQSLRNEWHNLERFIHFYSIDSSINYFAPINLLNRVKKNYENLNSSSYFQALATYNSFVENNDSLKNYISEWINEFSIKRYNAKLTN